jgi:hypothetical protein
MRGLRYAIGVGIPLLAGIAAGRLIEGVAVSLGALLVGVTDSGAPYRSRTGAMLIASVTVAVSTFVGQLVGGHDVAATAVLTATSFGAGMFVAFAMPTYLVALMCPLTVVAAEALPAGPGPALGRRDWRSPAACSRSGWCWWCGESSRGVRNGWRSPMCTASSRAGSPTRPAPTTADGST